MEDSEPKDVSLKKLYLLVRRFDLGGSQKPAVLLREVSFPDQCSSETMLQYFRKELELMSDDIVLKLRNQQGSLIIPKGSLPANTIDKPYNLDVVKVYQSMIPKKRSIYLRETDDMVKAMLKSFITRIDRVEEQIPDIAARRQYRIERQIQDIDQQLNFLKMRLDEADKVEWQGTLKNSPLW